MSGPSATQENRKGGWKRVGAAENRDVLIQGGGGVWEAKPPTHKNFQAQGWTEKHGD